MCLAPTTFSSGAKDDLATADVYKLNTSVPINSVQDIIDDAVLDNAGVLRSSTKALNIKLSEAEIAKANAEGLAAKNSAGLLERLKGASGEIAGLMRSIPAPALNGILKDIGLASAVNKIKTTINGVTRIMPNNMLPNISGAGSLINGVGCSPNAYGYYDQAANVGMYSGIINYSMMNGMGNSFGTMMSCRTDKNMINQVAFQSIPNAVAYSDSDSLFSMSQLTTPGAMNSRYPNLIDNYSTSYSTPNADGSRRDPYVFNTVTDSFNSINPSWNQATRQTSSGPESIFNISKINGGSNDFQNLIRAGVMTKQPNANPLMLLASVLPKTNVLSEINKKFPLTALLSTTSALASKDPITVLKSSLSGINTQKIPNINSNAGAGMSSTLNYDGTKTVMIQSRLPTTGEIVNRKIVYSRYGETLSDEIVF